MTWTESDGPDVAPPTRRGFGSSLIERALALETGGRATIHYKPSGVVCDIVLPKSSLVELSAVPFVAVELSQADIESNSNAMPTNPKILIVEDSYFVLLGLEAMCDKLGWQIVGPATRLGEALALARSETFDAALLDVNLDGEMSWEIADVLIARRIPFAFSTGYDQSNILPDHLIGTPVLAKPYRIDDVERRLRSMMTVGSDPIMA